MILFVEYTYECRILTFCFRVLTDIKSGSIAQEFLNSKPNTIWRQIYEKQMNDEKTATDYKIQAGSVIHLVLALRGGL